MKTLVILGAADGALPTYVTARRLGYRTIGIDQHADACSVERADEFLNITTVDAERIAAKLADRTDIVGALAPASDIALPTVRHLAQVFGLPCPPDSVIRASVDKTYFHQVCAELGLVRYRQVTGSDRDELAAEARGLTLPVVAKPADGTGSRGIRVCHEWSELDAALPGCLSASPTGTAVVEEYVSGDHYTLEGFVDEGDLVFYAVTARMMTPPPHALSTYHRFPSGLPGPTERSLADMVARACARIGYRTGPIDVDAVVTGDGAIELIEMGARVGGSGYSELIRNGTGVDIVAASIDAAVGLSATLTPSHAPRPASLTILHADRPGTLTGIGDLDGTRIPELAELEIVVPVGTALPAYHELSAKLGYAVLAADSVDRLDAAERWLAAAPLFQITPSGGTA